MHTLGYIKFKGFFSVQSIGNNYKVKKNLWKHKSFNLKEDKQNFYFVSVLVTQNYNGPNHPHGALYKSFK